MQENDTSITVEEGTRETKVAVRLQAYSCRSCGFMEFWKAQF
jgi:hypothetical protein